MTGPILSNLLQQHLQETEFTGLTQPPTPTLIYPYRMITRSKKEALTSTVTFNDVNVFKKFFKITNH